MWCPKCHSEFREGFEYCASCDVDLVERLSVPEAGAVEAEAKSVEADAIPRSVQRVEFCGFFSLEEASAARASLAESGLTSEILIRDAPRLQDEQLVRDEFWLRVDPADISLIRQVLDMLEEDPGGTSGPLCCSECGAKLDSRDRLCLRCGAEVEVSDDA